MLKIPLELYWTDNGNVSSFCYLSLEFEFELHNVQRKSLNLLRLIFFDGKKKPESILCMFTAVFYPSNVYTNTYFFIKAPLI